MLRKILGSYMFRLGGVGVPSARPRGDQATPLFRAQIDTHLQFWMFLLGLVIGFRNKAKRFSQR